MESMSVRKPDLIIRIGASLPTGSLSSVSNGHLYHFTPSLEADRRDSLGQRESQSPSKVPLPSSPHSPTEPVLDPSVTQGPPHLDISKAMLDRNQTTLQMAVLAASIRRRDISQVSGSGSNSLQLPSGSMENDEMLDISPLLPQNPSVTPVTPAGYMAPDQTVSHPPSPSFEGDRIGLDSTIHGTRTPMDYFSLPTCVPVTTGTPVLEAGSRPQLEPQTTDLIQRPLLASDSRPDSMVVNVDAAPWMVDFPMDGAGSDVPFDVRSNTTGPLAERQPLPDLSELFQPPSYQSDGAKDVMPDNSGLVEDNNVKVHSVSAKLYSYSQPQGSSNTVSGADSDSNPGSHGSKPLSRAVGAVSS